MHGVAIAIIVAVRLAMMAANHNKQSGGAGGGRPRFNVAGYRRPPSKNFLVPALVWTVVLPAFIACLFASIFDSARYIPLTIISGAIVFPYLISRYVLIPLGLVRTTWFLNQLGSVTWRADRRGGAILMAAWALTRRGNEKSIAWLEKKIAKAAPLRAAGVVAQALIAAKRGDKDGARILFESTETIHEHVRPKMALRIAREWRFADALARRDHPALKELLRIKSPLSRPTWLLRRIALRSIGQADTHPIWMWSLWVIAPRRLRTFALVARATRERFGAIGPARVPKVSVFIEPDKRPVEQAMRFEAALLARDEKHIQPPDLFELGRLWDQAFKGKELYMALAMRGDALGVQSIERVQTALDRALEDDLTKMIKGAEMTLGLLSKADGLVLRAVRRVRSDLLQETETACAAIRRRTDEKRALPPIDEWREWTALRAMLDHASQIGGMDLRRLRFSTVHSALCHVAVWLFNERKERAIANAIFTWLHDESNAIQNQQAIELQAKNLKCGAF